MTMHLEQGLTTLNLKKPKSRRNKLSDNQIKKYEKMMREHNKYMKQINCSHMQMSLKEYIDYCFGCYKAKKTISKTTFIPEIKTQTTNKPKVSVTTALPEPKAKYYRSSRSSWKEVQERLEISKQYSIAPAYNKGPYMVVAREDLKTAGKKV